MKYRYRNPNTGESNIVDAATAQRMKNNIALRGYEFEPVQETYEAPPPAPKPNGLPQKAKKPHSGKNKNITQ